MSRFTGHLLLRWCFLLARWWLNVVCSGRSSAPSVGFGIRGIGEAFGGFLGTLECQALMFGDEFAVVFTIDFVQTVQGGEFFGAGVSLNDLKAGRSGAVGGQFGNERRGLGFSGACCAGCGSGGVFIADHEHEHVGGAVFLEAAQ